eukprot:2809454-Ditylum_brightwellii.AAC.1
MTKDSKHVKWQNSVQNHQNGKLLPVLDPHIEGYDPVELYQLEMCVQCLSHGASTKHPTSDVQDKLKSLVMKLQEAHGRERFLLFTEKGERIKIETFPTNAVDLQRLFEYTVHEKGYKNVLLILHTMVPMSFYNCKTPVYQWLQLNKMYMTKP